jgi:hypothetical protein
MISPWQPSRKVDRLYNVSFPLDHRSLHRRKKRHVARQVQGTPILKTESQIRPAGRERLRDPERKLPGIAVPRHRDRIAKPAPPRLLLLPQSISGVFRLLDWRPERPEDGQ